MSIINQSIFGYQLIKYTSNNYLSNYTIVPQLEYVSFHHIYGCVTNNMIVFGEIIPNWFPNFKNNILFIRFFQYFNNDKLNIYL